MLVSVVIPCHGGVEDTRACVRSLLAQHGGPELQILIVDNGSPDATARLDAEFAGVEVLCQGRNRGFAGGVNAGLRAARGDLVLVLNNDTLAAPSLLRCLLRALASDRRIALVAPVSNRVKGAARVDVGAVGADATGRAELETLLAGQHGGRIEDVETLSGLCLLARRPLWQDLGGFDERFALGNFEDDDLCLRARLRGHRLVIARDAFLHHHGHRTFDSLGLDYRRTLAEHERLFRSKWRDDAAGAAYVARLEGNTAGAASLAGLAMVEHPHWPDAHWLLAREHAAKGRPTAAIAHLRTFLELCPCHCEASILLGLQHLAAGDEARGNRLLANAFRDLPLSAALAADTLARLASWCVEHGRDATARAHLEDAVAIAPDDGDLQNRLGALLLERGDLQRASTHLTRADALGNAHGATNLGICQWRLGDCVTALHTLRDAAERFPDNEVARHNLAQVAALRKCQR